MNTVCLVLGLALSAVGRGADSPAGEPGAAVAIVAAQSGPAAVVDGDGRRRPLQCFDWLRAEWTIETGAETKLTVVLKDGKRWMFGAHSSGRLSQTGIGHLRGEVVSLPAVPPLPLVLPWAKDIGARAAAVRLRGGRVSGLYPHEESSTLADATVLRFDTVPTAARYHVEVEAEDGRVVFETDAPSGEVVLPAGVLKAGAYYTWSVRSVGLEPAVRGRASFATLQTALADARAALRARLQADGDPANLAFMAEIDRSLGLLWEARDGFQSSLALSAEDVVRNALAQTERAIRSGKEQP